MNYTKVQKIISMFIQKYLKHFRPLNWYFEKKNIFSYYILLIIIMSLFCSLYCIEKYDRLFLSNFLIKWLKQKGLSEKYYPVHIFLPFYWWTWITNLLESENTTRLSSPWCCFNNWDRRLLLQRWEELFSVELVALLLPSGVVFLDIFVEASPMKNKNILKITVVIR